MKQVVSSQVKNKIAIITIFNPPVNSLSAAVREQLLFSIEKSDDDENIDLDKLFKNGIGEPMLIHDPEA